MNPSFCQFDASALLLAVGIVLTSAAGGHCQPAISSIQLSGHPQTIYDSFHPYARFSASVGANVTLTVIATGPAPLSYQWQFNGANLPNETNKTLPFIALALTNAGDYTAIVTNLSGGTNSVVTLQVDPTFTKIMDSPVVTNADTSQGGFFADYNNDGFLDLFVVNGQDGKAANPFLYRNNGDGTFFQVLSGPPVDVSSQAPSACWGDYDNDGNIDLFVTATGPHFLYHNNGDGTFARILHDPTVTNSAISYGCLWGDYDNDGFLDLFVTTIDPAALSHCYLFRNKGDGTFTKETNSILVADSASSIGCAWGDYDDDGKPDLFVCGGRGPNAAPAPNRLYHNEGHGVFTRVTTGRVVTDADYSGSCAWGDYDNDGYLDLFVVNGFGGLNFLYHNRRDGTFERITNSIVTTDVGNNWFGCAWGDYDNDGFLDLLVTDEGYNDASVVNALYHNNGDGTFTKITNGSPVNEYSDSIGCAWADYDNDGFLDLFVTRGDGRGNALYHNNGNSNAWLTVKLVGTVSNRSAIGARVRVRAFYRGAERWQLRQITGGGGWGSQQELRANFGLGDATNAATVRIEWPSGTVQEFQDVAPRQILTITEPPRLLASATNGLQQFYLKGGRGFQYEIDSSPDLYHWSTAGTLTITNLSGTAMIIDTNPPASDQRFYRAVSH